MAKTTITQVTDDLDGSKDATEVAFSFGGVDYTIDLGRKNRAAFEKAMKPYVDAAIRVSKRSSSQAGRSKRDTSDSPNLSAVRAWAKANGLEVSDRGRVAQSLLDRYAAEAR